MLVTMNFIKVGDEFELVNFSEVLVVYAIKSIVQKCWRQMSAIIISRNAGNNTYSYNFWRAPQQI